MRVSSVFASFSLMIGQCMRALLLLMMGTVSSHAGADLQTEIARAEAVFIAVYDPHGDPALRVERVLYKGAPPFGDMAILQGVNTMLDRIRSSTPRPAHGRRDVVFARTVKGGLSRARVRWRLLMPMRSRWRNSTSERGNTRSASWPICSLRGRRSELRRRCPNLRPRP